MASHNDTAGPLLAIGLGLSRTGTTSLKHALEIIYGHPCYHGLSMPSNHYAKWIEIDNMVQASTVVDPAKFQDIYRGYRSATDMPTSSFYKQLLETYPDAKFILTTREPSRWLESIRETFLPRERILEPTNWAEVLVNGLVLSFRFSDFFKKMLKRTYGADVDVTDDDQLLAAYHKHNQDVKATVPKDKLLVFRVQQGWAPLCEFLRVPVPDTPFPRLNEREILISFRTKSQRLANAVYWFGNSVVTVGSVWIAYHLFGYW